MAGRVSRTDYSLSSTGAKADRDDPAGSYTRRMAGTARFPSSRLPLAALVAGSLTLGSCSTAEDEPGDTVLVASGTTCDRELGTDQAQSINEQVGGLRTEDFVVNFSQTTEAGNVALVTGDLEKAFDVLTEDYGVAVVAEYEDDDSGRIVGFEQIRTLIEDICADE